MDGGSSILSAASNSTPLLVMSNSMMETSNDTETADIRQSVKFIKERLKALKQIATLDEATMLEGGWTQNDVREELLKLQSELSNEKMRVTLYNDQNNTSNSGVRRRDIIPSASSPSKLYDPFASTSSTMSASREHLFSDDVAKKLQILTKKLDRTWKAHEKEERLKKNGKNGVMKHQSLLSHLIPQSLLPLDTDVKPLFRGDRSPDGLKRQRRRARASITLRNYSPVRRKKKVPDKN